MAELKSYPILSPVLDGRRYEIGETINLDEAAANPLLIAGAIGEATGAAASTKPPTAAEQIDKIKTAATAEDIDAILGSDTRATVVAAAAARKAELAQG